MKKVAEFGELPETTDSRHVKYRLTSCQNIIQIVRPKFCHLLRHFYLGSQYRIWACLTFLENSEFRENAQYLTFLKKMIFQRVYQWVKKSGHFSSWPCFNIVKVPSVARNGFTLIKVPSVAKSLEMAIEKILVASEGWRVVKWLKLNHRTPN